MPQVAAQDNSTASSAFHLATSFSPRQLAAPGAPFAPSAANVKRINSGQEDTRAKMVYTWGSSFKNTKRKLFKIMAKSMQ